MVCWVSLVSTAAILRTSQNAMGYPTGMFIDRDNRLWVADKFNHRVLRFDNAAEKENGGPANGVLGQELFTTRDLLLA